MLQLQHCCTTARLVRTYVARIQPKKPVADSVQQDPVKPMWQYHMLAPAAAAPGACQLTRTLASHQPATPSTAIFCFKQFQRLTQHRSGPGGDASALAGSYIVLAGQPLNGPVASAVGLPQVGLKIVTVAVSLTGVSDPELSSAVLVYVPDSEPVAVRVSVGNDPPTLVSRQIIS